MISYKKNIALVYLGDLLFDARIINMAITLLQNNWKVSFIGCSTEKTELPPLISAINIIPIMLKHRGVRQYFEYYYKARKALRTETFNVIIAGDLYSLASAVAAKQGKQRLIYDCREIYTHLNAHINRPMKRFILSLYEKYYIKFFNAVFVTAETDLQYLMQKYKKYSHLKWDVIYNFPINIALDLPLDIHQKFNLALKYKIICYQGVIQEGRGLQQLLLVIKNSKHLACLIIGSGEGKKKYQKIASQYNITNRVLFLARVPYLSLFKYTAACDVGWAVIKSHSLSNRFALPNKVFEYGLMNLPVIASRLPNLVALFGQYRLGKLVDEHNTSQQIQAIDALIAQAYNYQEVVVKHFTWEKQKNKFIALVNEQ